MGSSSQDGSTDRREEVALILSWLTEFFKS
jgi:hypothetical protein